jgi:ClpP class serine protease
LNLIITVLICVTAVIVTHLITKNGITINMTYTNKDKETLTEFKQSAAEESQRAGMDQVISEIYDAFDINIDSKEANE